MNFGDTITKLRNEAGLSQQEIASKINIARATYAGLEVNRRQPNLSEIKNISAFYQINPMSLIEGDLSKSKNISPQKIIFNHNNASEPQRQTVFDIEYEKIRSVFLYILSKIGAKPNIGETALYKILYFIDFDFYEKNGKSITNLKYVHNHYGPTPQTATFKSFVDTLVGSGDVEIVETKRIDLKMKKYLPTKNADLSIINADELKHIDDELARLSDKSAKELTKLSHQDMPWLATKANEVIDYQLAMYRTPATSVSEPKDEL